MSDSQTPAAGAAPFGRLWASTAANNLADGIVHLVVPVAAVGRGATPTQVALVVAAQLAPWLALSPVSGVLVDRLSAYAIIRSASALRAAAGVGLLVALDSAIAPIALLAVTAAALGAAEVVADITAQTAVPDVVADTELEWAYGRVKATQIAGDTLLGPALGGLLLSLSAPSAILPAIGLFILGGAIVPPIDQRPGTNQGQGLRTQLAQGWRTSWDDRWIRRALLTVAAMNAGSVASATALVVYAVEPGPLGLSEAEYGLLIGTAGLGAAIGGPLAGNLSRTLRPNLLIRIGAFGHLIVISAPAIAWSPPVLAALLLVGSMLGPSLAITVISTRQRRVPPATRGRVNALFQTITTGTGTTSALAAGVMVTTLGYRATFIAASLLATTITLASRPWRLNTGTP
ncbi:MAG: MFS transporter [Actinomycetota bacterium]